jgi:competence transcription factor ComK
MLGGMIMISYEVNCDTLALIPVSENETKIIERDNSFIVNKPVMEIIEDSCEYFGSSYLGRHEGTKKLIGITHKAPIIIEESKNLIYLRRLSVCIKITVITPEDADGKNTGMQSS